MPVVQLTEDEEDLARTLSTQPADVIKDVLKHAKDQQELAHSNLESALSAALATDAYGIIAISHSMLNKADRDHLKYDAIARIAERALEIKGVTPAAS